jgi:hypothetical protein
MGLLYFNQGRIRPDLIHIMPSLVVTFILISFLLQRAVSSAGRKNQIVLVGLVLAVTLAYCVDPIKGWWTLYRASGRTEGTFLFESGPARGIRTIESNRPYREAIEYVRRKVPAGDRIFVGNTEHDRVVISDVLFYFLAERHSATKYHEGHPGLTTTAEVQNRIVDDILQWDCQYVVLATMDNFEPNESANSSGVFILDDFIRSNYRPDRQFGRYGVWKRTPPAER